MFCTITLNPQPHKDWESPPSFTLKYLSLDEHDEKVELGRGQLTKLYDTVISRRVCSVEFLDPQNVSKNSNKRKTSKGSDDEGKDSYEAVPILRIHKEPDKHKVAINGIKVSVNMGDYVILNDKDILSIHLGRPFQYKISVNRQLRVPICDTRKRRTISEACQVVMPKAPLLGHTFPSVMHIPTEPHGNQSVAEKAMSNLSDEIKCPICMDIYVESHASNPCGHMFCGPCVRDWIGNNDPKDRLKCPIECPSCRCSIRSFTQVRQYDSMIWNLLLSRPFPQEDFREDLLVFLQRCGKEISSLSPEEHICLFGSGNVSIQDCGEQRA